MRIIPSQSTVDLERTSETAAPELLANHKTPFFWLLLAPLLVAVASLASTLSPNDFWGHVAAGRWMAQNNAIATTNIFSWGAPLDAPYPYPSWGAAWLMYQILRSTGFTGIVAVRAACAAGAWAILCVAAWRRVRRTAPQLAPERAAQIVAFAALLAFGMAGTNLDARPQMFALPLFALAVALLMELPYRVRSKSTVLCAIFSGAALWANAHGSFFLAVALPLGALAGEALRRILRGRSDAFGAPLPNGACGFLALWAIAATLGSFVNPRGIHVWDYIFSLTANQTVQQYIYEWQAPRFGEGPGTVFFGAALLLGALAFFAMRAPRDDGNSRCGLILGESLVLLALFALGSRNLRSVLWFALFFIPAASAIAASYLCSRSTVEIDRTPARRKFDVLPQILCGVLLLCALVFWPPIKARIAWPQGFIARYAPSPAGEVALVLDNATPVLAAQSLRAAPPRRLWNDMGQGAYLAWALPAGTPRCDWRIELFPDAFWHDYLRLSQGPPDAVAQLRALNISDVLCDREAQPGLIKRLQQAPDWTEKTFGRSVLFHQTQAGNEP